MASYKQHNDGLWEYRIRYKDSNGKFREKSKKGFIKKKLAELEAAKIEKQIYEGINIESSDILISTFLKEWLEVAKKGKVSDRTYNAYEIAINNHLIPLFGDKKLKQLSRLTYQKELNKLSEKFSYATVRRIHITMHGAFEFALNELNIIERNPLTKVKISKEIEVKEDEIKCYTREELELFLSSCTDYKYHTVFKFLSRTGLRIGECLALQWSDIDFKEKTIKVTKTLHTQSHQQPIEFGPPKSRKNRTIMIDDDTVKFMKVWRIEQGKLLFKYGKRYEGLDFVFINNENLVLLNEGCVRNMINICEKIGLKYITPHGLRHTHAVHLLQSGIDIKTVSERLGHKKIDVTANTYLHVTKEIEEAAIRKYNNFLNNCGQDVGS